MKKCSALSKYMQHKGMKAIQTNRDETDGEGYDEPLSDKDVTGTSKDLYDREGSKSKKATKALDRYQKMKGKK